ncbi:MAG: hypothetical protein QOF55_311 [Thermoleophilaceae bacterium]|nr:hypothetical protein [Thermoleophilaceae bacterium]
MSLDHAVATARRLLEPIARFTDHGDYLVYRSDRFPTYCAANGIEIRATRGLGLDGWEAIFDREFGPGTFEHRTFTFNREPEFEPLASAAATAGYDVTFLSYLIATEARPPGPVPAGFTLEPVESEEAWQRLGRLEDRMSKDDPWYEGPESSERLFAKTRYVSEQVGIEWLTLLDADGALATKLGLFRHGPVYRLQDVGTAPEYRRRGLSSYLLRVALARALHEGGADGLVVEADTEYHAIDLYRKLGFRDVGETAALMLFPQR